MPVTIAPHTTTPIRSTATRMAMVMFVMPVKVSMTTLMPTMTVFRMVVMTAQIPMGTVMVTPVTPPARALRTTVRMTITRIRLTGNIDNDPEDLVDLGDLTKLIDYLFISFGEPDCMAEANTDGDPEGLVDLGDLTKLIDYLFISFTPPAECL